MTFWQTPNMKGWSMRIFFHLGVCLFTCREVGKWRKCKSILGSNFANIEVVQQIGSGRIEGDAGCDRMVFAINSNQSSTKFNSFFNKLSLDQGHKTMKTIWLTISSFHNCFCKVCMWFICIYYPSKAAWQLNWKAWGIHACRQPILQATGSTGKKFLVQNPSLRNHA